MPRLLRLADLPDLMRLKEAAGWNQTEDDWRRVLEVEPEGCFGIDCDGTLAASATAVCYGGELAWIGMVLTLPQYRGRGLARRLMEHAVAFAAGRGVRWAKLDATDMGAPLYARLGFEPECAIERWGREIRGRTEAAPVPGGLDRELDREAFGADRWRLLESLAALGSASVPGQGFALARPGSRAAYFGPCVSRSTEAARRLLEWFLAAHPGETVCWDLLPDNAAAVELAREYGFEPVRKLVRMARRLAPGEGIRAEGAKVFASAGFEYG
jgi:GNAT superfamily N-acetyltransferase